MSDANKALFLSYASQDAEAAKRICAALRNAGIEVWFDQSELTGGDAWDAKIRGQIGACALFVPVISANTQARLEGYFRLEWKLAANRSHTMAEEKAFLLPVVIDTTREAEGKVPPEFRAVQWTRLPGGETPAAFVVRVQRLLGGPSAPILATTPVPTQPASVARASKSGPLMWVTASLAAGLLALAAFVVVRPASKDVAPVSKPATELKPASPPAAAQPHLDFAGAKSIAVLPFTNMSPDAENAFFADGMHEDILTNLALIRELRVVSRTSVMGYRGTTKKIRDVASELGVTYILEGSVRRSGNKVRVTGQLIHAATDEHVWAKSYDRDLTDIFALQAALATEIAGALQTALSPQEKKFLERRPTENIAAYDLYLKARDTRGVFTENVRKRSEALFQAAVELDPNFAEAWAGLAWTHANAVYFGRDASAARLGKAKSAIERAVSLAPGSPEFIRSLGQYYSISGDFDQAAEQFEKLVALQPNDANSYNSFGNTRRSQGRWLDALALHRKAVQLDPGDPFSAQTLSNTLASIRQWDAAIAERRRLATLRPERLADQYNVGRTVYLAHGSRREAVECLANLSPAQRGSPEGIAALKSWAILSGDFAEALRLDRLQPYVEVFDVFDHESSAAAEAAAVHVALGDFEGARRRMADFPAVLRRRLEQETTNAVLWSDLGLMQAMLGQPGEALRSVRRATELVDAQFPSVRPRYVVSVAAVLAWAGDKEAAIAELARLLGRPGQVSVHELRSGPWLVSLRGDPRFEALLNDPKNNAPLF